MNANLIISWIHLALLCISPLIGAELSFSKKYQFHSIDRCRRGRVPGPSFMRPGCITEAAIPRFANIKDKLYVFNHHSFPARPWTVYRRLCHCILIHCKDH
ncbi:hypothetical protein J3A83DRAFT_2914203 [Scleroderma citrinum]